jgi:hypothetical protein
MRYPPRRFPFLLSALCSLLSFTGCRDQENFKGAEIVCQRYEGKTMRPIGPGSPYLKVAEEWRKTLDRRSRELGRAAGKCPSVENIPQDTLTYEYHTAWDDTADGNVVLYYFAPIHNPKVYAGYGIHAVVGVRENRLKKVCVFPVPLE